MYNTCCFVLLTGTVVLRKYCLLSVAHSLCRHRFILYTLFLSEQNPQDADPTVNYYDTSAYAVILTKDQFWNQLNYTAYMVSPPIVQYVLYMYMQLMGVTVVIHVWELGLVMSNVYWLVILYIHIFASLYTPICLLVSILVVLFFLCQYYNIRTLAVGPFGYKWWKGHPSDFNNSEIPELTLKVHHYQKGNFTPEIKSYTFKGNKSISKFIYHVCNECWFKCMLLKDFIFINYLRFR